MMLKNILFVYAALCAADVVLGKNIQQMKMLMSKLRDFPDPLCSLDAVGMIRYNGYTAQQHTVKTDDGYLLQIQRIPSGITGKSVKSPKTGKKEVVLLQHGLEGCSINWIANLPNQSFAFILADAGYDVWLGNMRGNTYGTLKGGAIDPSKREFWDFSFNEMAQYDLPAMINYILTNTSQEQLYYIGHSQGTMIGFAHFSENATTAAKVKQFHALGPVTTVHYITTSLRILAEFTNQIDFFFQLFGEEDFLPDNDWLHKLAQYACGTNYTEAYCDNLIFQLMGSETKNMNKTRIPVYISHCPAGTSTKNIAHFGQLVKSGKFCKYDYGSVENLVKYKQLTPPDYPVENIMVPVSLFWGEDDDLADPKDVAGLLKKLPANRLIGSFEITDYAHLDFIWAQDASTRVYNAVMSLMQQQQ